MHNGFSLAELARRNVSVLPHEAVAIAQKLINGACGEHPVLAPFGPPSVDTIVIGVDGDVQCCRSAATPSVSEVAIFLQSVLEGRRLPGGLRYTMGRALLDVDAPPFDSVHDLSAALERFEDGDRDAVIAGLARRAAVEGAGRCAGEGGWSGERRRNGPAVARLREELRLADLELYEARRAARAAYGSGGSLHARRADRHRRVLSAPVAACMLAGVALVMAGEVSERRSRTVQNVATGRVSATAAAPSAGPARATDIALPPSLHEEASPSTRARMPARPLVRRANAPRPANRQRATATRSRATEDHDAFIARIRYEWDNPSNRGH